MWTFTHVYWDGEQTVSVTVSAEKYSADAHKAITKAVADLMKKGAAK